MSSFVRKHVPDSDPGCALQSPSMPALHRRILPNCRPMVDGGMRKCSAGACPPLGLGWGSAESTVPIRCTKPQLPLFIPWCAGASRHERFVRKCAYAAFERAVEPLHSAISSFRPPNSSFPRRACPVPRYGAGIQRGGAGCGNDARTLPTNQCTRFSYLGVPAPAGMSDCYESMSRTTIRDRLPPPTSSFQRSKARPVPLIRGWNPEGEGQDRHTIGENPAAHNFPSLS